MKTNDTDWAEALAPFGLAACIFAFMAGLALLVYAGQAGAALNKDAPPPPKELQGEAR